MMQRKDTLCNLIGTIMVPFALPAVATQGHGGTMTGEGEGATFIVSLPTQPSSWPRHAMSIF